MATLSAAKVAKLSKNPGTRSKVPTAQLAPKYQKMRKANAARAATNDPNALTAPLTPRTLDQQVQAQTSLYAAPAEQALNDRQAVSNQMAVNIPSWFADYQAAQQHATDQTKTAYGAAIGASQNAAASGSALDAQQQATQQAQMQADATIRGGTVDPAIAAQAQQASASRRAGVDTQTALTSGLGAAQTAYRAGQQTVGAAQKLQAQQGEAQRSRNIATDRGTLAAKKGDFATTTRQKLIDAEHTKQLENKAFGLNVQKAADATAATSAKIALDAKGLQLKQQTAAAAKVLNAAKLTNDQAKIQIAQQNADTAAKRETDYATGRASKAAGKGKTPAVNGAARKDVDYALNQIQQLRQHVQPVKVPATDSKGNVIPNKFVTKLDARGNPVTKGGKAPSDAQIRDALLNGSGPLRNVPDAAITAALSLLGPGGSLSSKEIAKLRAAYPGIHIQGLGYTTERQQQVKLRKSVKAAKKNPPRVSTGDILAGTR